MPQDQNPAATGRVPVEGLVSVLDAIGRVLGARTSSANDEAFLGAEALFGLNDADRDAWSLRPR